MKGPIIWSNSPLSLNTHNLNMDGYNLALISSFAYKSKGEFCTLVKKHWPSKRHPLSVNLIEDCCTDTQAYILIDRQSKNMVVAFRGTEPSSFIDMLTDLECITVPEYGNLLSSLLCCFSGIFNADKSKVHLGFKIALDSVFPQIISSIKHFKNSELKGKIWFTGHSLGGALAALAAHRCMHMGLEGKNFGGLYTYGAPHIGNAPLGNTISQELHDKAFSYMMHGDIIPSLSPFSCSKIGKLIPIRTDSSSLFINHSIEHYIEELRLDKNAQDISSTQLALS